jgi:hypothetical protein
MNEIMPCPACGAIHRPLAPENPYATQIIGDGPKLTWEDFSEDDREVTVFQVICTNCDFQGPHAEQRRQACAAWNDNARLLEKKSEPQILQIANAA